MATKAEAFVDKTIASTSTDIKKREKGKALATDFNKALKATNEKLPMNSIAHAIRMEHHNSFPTTPLELHNYIRIMYGMDVPWVPVVDGFDSPFDAYVAIYFRLYDKMLQMGPRNSGKTKGLSVLADLTSRARARSTWVHASAQKSQADVVGKAMEEYRQDKVLGLNYTYDTHVSTIRFKNASFWYRVTGTPSGVNSHHPHTLSLDEIEWWSVAAIDQTYAVPTSNDGVLDVWVGVSTRQRAGGAMAYLYQEADKLGIKKFSYTIFECMEPCRTCIALDREPFGTDEQRNNVCALWEDCMGVLGRKCQGFIPRQKVEQYKKLRTDLWDTQFMCRAPSTNGLVYPTFSQEEARFSSHGVYKDGGNIYAWKYNDDWPYEIWIDPAEGGTATAWFIQRDPRYGYLYAFDLLTVPNCAHDSQIKEALVEYINDKGYPDPEFVLIDPHKPETRKFFASGVTFPTTGVMKKFNALSPKMPRDIDRRNGEIRGTIPILASYFLDAHRKRWFFVHPKHCEVGIKKGITQYSYPMDQKTFEVHLNSNPVKDGSDDFCDPLRYGVIYDKKVRGGGPTMGYQQGNAIQQAKMFDSELSSMIDL